MSRLPSLVVSVRNDALGKPYLTIESDPETQRDLRDATPIRLALWADSIRVEDERKDR